MLCENCRNELSELQLYCHQCGQRNKSSKVKFREFISEFFDTIFNINNKFFITIFALFVPAKLTKAYIDGKRKSYYHPLRIYVVSIVFFFFIISFVKTEHLQNSDKENQESLSAAEIQDSLQFAYNLLKEDSVITGNTSWDNFLTNLKIIDKIKLEDQKFHIEKSFRAFNMNESDPSYKEYTDSLFNTLYFVYGSDTILLKEINDTSKVNMGGFFNRGVYYPMSRYEAYHMDIKDVAMKYEPERGFKRILLQQEIKIRRDFSSLTRFIYGNLIWLLLALIPLFALILKLFYIFSKRLYVEHFVFMLHVMTAIVSIWTIVLLMFIFMENNNYGWFFLIISMAVYPFISFIRYYKQHWFITWIKYVMLGFIFFFCTLLSASLFLVISSLIL